MGGDMVKEKPEIDTQELMSHYENGAHRWFFQKSTDEMSRVELIAVIGFLEETATARMHALREVGSWENMGDRISDAWDMANGEGAWDNLLV